MINTEPLTKKQQEKKEKENILCSYIILIAFRTISLFDKPKKKQKLGIFFPKKIKYNMLQTDIDHSFGVIFNEETEHK